jgi:DNA-binding transcriptional regulator GbsR (MarR family)
MQTPLKQKLGVEGLEKLNELIRHESDIRHISTNFEVHKKALEMLLKWIGSVYEIDAKQIKAEEPDIDLNKLYKDKEE